MCGWLRSRSAAPHNPRPQAQPKLKPQPAALSLINQLTLIVSRTDPELTLACLGWQLYDELPPLTRHLPLTLQPHLYQPLTLTPQPFNRTGSSSPLRYMRPDDEQIKCSTCGAWVNLLALGEHACRPSGGGGGASARRPAGPAPSVVQSESLATGIDRIAKERQRERKNAPLPVLDYGREAGQMRAQQPRYQGRHSGLAMATATS